MWGGGYLRAHGPPPPTANTHMGPHSGLCALPQDEYNSSKFCSKCEEELLTKGPRTKECRSAGCEKNWNRDVNGSVPGSGGRCVRVRPSSCRVRAPGCRLAPLVPRVPLPFSA